MPNPETIIEPKADERPKEWRKPSRVDTSVFAWTPPVEDTEHPKIAEIETEAPYRITKRVIEKTDMRPH